MSKHIHRRNKSNTRNSGRRTLIRRTGFEKLESREVLSAVTLAPIDDVTVLSGAPLHIPLDGFADNGEAVTYEVEIDGNVDLEYFIPQNNRDMRIDVDGFGTMIFELFEGRAPRVTEQIITLAEAGFYDGLTFHRILNNFMIQGGDQDGSGSGPAPLGDFDDQFHVDLQHTSGGLLSMAKSNDDTNGTQFFITEVPTRWLDYNHSIFGMLTEGESVRAAISDVPADPDSGVPESTVYINSVEIFDDIQNGTLMLKADEGLSGSVTVTVTARNASGDEIQQTFSVTVTPDSQNSNAFLHDVPEIHTTVDTEVIFQLYYTDVEGTPGNQFFSATSHNDLICEIDTITGEVTVTPTNGLVGRHDVYVGMGLHNPDDIQAIPIYIDPAEVPTVDVDTTLVLDPTAVDAAGEIDSLLESVQSLDEWDSFYVEIWGSTPDGTDLGIVEFTFDMAYNTDYFSATSIEYGNSFPSDYYTTYVQTQFGLISDPTGQVLKVGATTAAIDAGDDAHVLLARIHFQPTDDDAGVNLNLNGEYATAADDLGLVISDVEVLVGTSVVADVQLGETPDPEVRPVIYDLDDDGQIGQSDVDLFESVYRDDATAPGATLAVAADFDRSGQVGAGDFAFLSVNYQRQRNDGQTSQLPVNYFPQALMARPATALPQNAAQLSEDQLAPIVQEAYSRLDILLGPQATASLDDINVQIADLGGETLGQASGNTIVIDDDAAGYGWFVDETPEDDAEFSRREGTDQFMAALSDEALGKVDLLSAVMHEMGHLLGLEHDDAISDDDDEGDIMSAILEPGLRRWMIDAE